MLPQSTNDSVGMNETYEVLFTSVWPSGSTCRTTIHLRHYADGPTLNLECDEFLASYQHQTRVLQQRPSGWHPANTTAYCLKNPKFDISSYVQACTKHAVGEVCKVRHPVAFFFRLAWLHRDVSTLSMCEPRANLCRRQSFAPVSSSIRRSVS